MGVGYGGWRRDMAREYHIPSLRWMAKGYDMMAEGYGEGSEGYDMYGKPLRCHGAASHTTHNGK